MPKFGERKEEKNSTPKFRALQKYPLVVDPVIGDVRLTKVLMDGAAASTSSTPRPSGSCVSICPRSGQAWRLFTRSSPENASNPSDNSICPSASGLPPTSERETLTFEVVGFRGTYHAVLGRPCYAQFMAVPNYTYLKIKMTGPNGVITVGPTYRHAYECDVECVEYAEALAKSEALLADLESLS